MTALCKCDESDESHEHCSQCDCILRWNEGDVCCWCYDNVDEVINVY